MNWFKNLSIPTQCALYAIGGVLALTILGAIFGGGVVMVLVFLALIGFLGYIGGSIFEDEIRARRRK